MSSIVWERFARVTHQPHVHAWLIMHGNLGLARNTLIAYAAALEDYLDITAKIPHDPVTATRETIAHYVHDLATRPNPRLANRPGMVAHAGLANATMQQRLTAIRLFYDYLMEQGLRTDNPVGRGRFTPGKAFGGQRDRGLIPRYHTLPWIPSEDQWAAILTVVRTESLRTRVMFALTYEAALRREEVCHIATGDLDPAHRLLRIRAETTKNRQERVVPYSAATGTLYMHYLQQRRQLSAARGSLFLSESRRNYAQPISIWTWSKTIAAIAARADIAPFTTHTLRHLRLTDLARADWELHAIARFAGHRSLSSALHYIHLSGRDLAAKLERSMTAVHAQRVARLAEVLT